MAGDRLDARSAVYLAIHKRRATTHVARQAPSQAGCDEKAAFASLCALRIWLDIRRGTAPRICGLLGTTRSTEDLIRGSLGAAFMRGASAYRTANFGTGMLSGQPHDSACMISSERLVRDEGGKRSRGRDSLDPAPL
jgi:hypothetical protein